MKGEVSPAIRAKIFAKVTSALPTRRAARFQNQSKSERVWLIFQQAVQRSQSKSRPWSIEPPISDQVTLRFSLPSLSLQFFACKLLSREKTFRHEEGHHETQHENRDYIFHGSPPLPHRDPGGENHHSHSHPQAENARHPYPHEEPVFVTHDEPKSYARNEADECSDKERVINLVKHGGVMKITNPERGWRF